MLPGEDVSHRNLHDIDGSLKIRGYVQILIVPFIFLLSSALCDKT